MNLAVNRVAAGVAVPPAVLAVAVAVAVAQSEVAQSEVIIGSEPDSREVTTGAEWRWVDGANGWRWS